MLELAKDVSLESLCIRRLLRFRLRNDLEFCRHKRRQLRELAQVDALNQPVTVKKVLRAPFKKGPAEGEKLTLANLNQCDKKDWSGTGEYVIPLSAYPGPGGGTDFLVTRVEARLLGLHDLPNNPQFLPHVYRATPETLAQLKQLTGPDETP